MGEISGSYVTWSVDTLAEEFEHLAFGPAISDPRNVNLLRRWTKPIRILAIFGRATPEDVESTDLTILHNLSA